MAKILRAYPNPARHLVDRDRAMVIGLSEFNDWMKLQIIMRRGRRARPHAPHQIKKKGVHELRAFHADERVSRYRDGINALHMRHEHIRVRCGVNAGLRNASLLEQGSDHAAVKRNPLNLPRLG